jgi:hypothetical protein
VTHRDEAGRELHDLPELAVPAGDRPLPVRFLARWDQALLAYEQRDRILPPELKPLQLGHRGDQTVLVDGRIAASWKLRRAARVTTVEIAPHRPIPKRVHRELRTEAERIARFCVPGVEDVALSGL